MSEQPSGLPGLVLQPEPAQPQVRTDRVAVAALVCGVVGLAPVAVLLGVVGISRTKDGTDVRGRRFAITGAVLGLLWMVAVAAVLVFALVLGSRVASAVQDTGPGKTLISDSDAAGTTKTASEVEQGDCLAAWDADTLASGDVVQVDCAVPHQAQAFGQVDLSDTYGETAAFPGPEPLVQAAVAGCTAQLASAVDPARGKGLAVDAIPPSVDDWAAGSRTATCLVTGPKQDSVADSVLT